MRVGLLSDTHDRVPAIDALLKEMSGDRRPDVTILNFANFASARALISSACC